MDARTPRILVTGFEPFAGLGENPAAVVAHEVSSRELPGIELVSAVLPVRFHGLSERVSVLIHEHQPAAVLCLGVAIGSPVVRVETTAMNRADFGVADDQGESVHATMVLAGPAAHFATYDAPAVASAIRAAGVPAALSHHAGTYLCNLTLFSFLEALAPSRPCGFLHLPLFPEHVAALLSRHERGASMAPLATPETASMERSLQTRAVTVALETMRDALLRAC